MLWTKKTGKNNLQNKLGTLNAKALQEFPKQSLFYLIIRNRSLLICKSVFCIVDTDL